MYKITASASEVHKGQMRDTKTFVTILQKSCASCSYIDSVAYSDAGCHPQELYTTQYLGLLCEDRVQDHGQHHRDGP